MARTFRVEIVTPERTVYAGEAASLRVPAYRGSLGVLAGHAPMLCLLEPGVVVLREGAARRTFAVGGGYLDVSEGRVLVLADSAEAPEEIDRRRAAEAADRARGRVDAPGSEVDPDRAARALQRALNRLRLAGRHDEGECEL